MSGGAVANSFASNPIIQNSILWGDTAEFGPEIFNNDTSTPVISYSDIQGDLTPGNGNINKDPLLGSPGKYGGGVNVLPILPGSSAIGAGDNATCADKDVRGISRPQMGICDMGAFESRGFTLALVGGDNQSATVLTPFSAPLEVSISSSMGEPVDGGRIRFSPPVTGARANLTGNPATIAGGSASVTATANAYAGTYIVTASAAGASNTVDFHLTNEVILIHLPLIIR